MTILFFPGRHLLHTSFQEQYIRQIIGMPPASLNLIGETPATDAGPIDTIVFAITSANHQFTRYNPIPFHVRAIGVDRFARALEQSFGVRYHVFGIPHYAPTPRFLEFVLKEIAEQTEGDLILTPDGCIVLSSTPALIEMARNLGFGVLTAEQSVAPSPATPAELLARLVDAGADWHIDPGLRAQLSPSTFDLWHDFPEVARRVLRLWRDPLLNDQGLLSAERNYSSYAQAMGNAAVIDLKVRDIANHIRPGRIVDEGCADGALLVRIAQGFPDSDLIGIEITGELLARCVERQRAGEFGETFVHFHQRNLTEPIFEPGSIDTTICNSTIHELWSYNDERATVMAYLAEKYRQLRVGGRLVIRDVVGPDHPEQTVYMWLDDGDGSNRADADTPVAALSTRARFARFADDFLPQRRRAGVTTVPFHHESRHGETYVVTTLKLAAEYMAKKDYVENWSSEMHEEFTFWGMKDWITELHAAGFQVILTAAGATQASHVYTNPWIVEHRWRGKVALYRLDGDSLVALAYPPTTVVMVAKKAPSPLSAL